jgi:hypothetical protein
MARKATRSGIGREQAGDEIEICVPVLRTPSRYARPGSSLSDLPLRPLPGGVLCLRAG